MNSPGVLWGLKNEKRRSVILSWSLVGFFLMKRRRSILLS